MVRLKQISEGFMKIINMRKGSWGKLTAFFDVCTDEGFILKGFKLVNGINGMFVGFPSQKGNDDEYYDTIWLTEEVRENMREKLNNMAVEVYNKDSGDIPTPAENMSTPSNENQSIPQTEESDVKVEAPFSDDDLPF